jgi:acetoin utilization protein AcuB
LGSLNVWEISRYLANLTVEKVMAKGKDLHTIRPEATLEDAANIMIRNNVDGLIVTDDQIVVGILTEMDLLTELCELLGASDPGWRVTVRAPDELGEFARLTEVIAQQGWCIMAMGNVRTPKVQHHWDIVLKIHGCTRETLLPVLESIEGQKVIDIRQTDNGSTAEILSLAAKRGSQ